MPLDAPVMTMTCSATGLCDAMAMLLPRDADASVSSGMSPPHEGGRNALVVSLIAELEQSPAWTTGQRSRA
jgi:hypothetical protein